MTIRFHMGHVVQAVGILAMTAGAWMAYCAGTLAWQAAQEIMNY